jgi:hypothetical protein
MSRKLSSVALPLVLALAFHFVSSASAMQKPTIESEKAQGSPVHFVIINLSGKSRQAHLRNAVVTLPVAERIPLEAPSGSRLEITSDTNQHIERVIAIASTDEGRIIPID